MTIQVSDAIFEFWTGYYQCDNTNIFVWASDRAYFDMNRTLTFKESTNGKNLAEVKRIENDRKVIRRKASRIIETYCVNKITRYNNFDHWHWDLCNELIVLYKGEGILKERRSQNVTSLTYGQAQKWVNMTIKYLWMTKGNIYDMRLDNLMEYESMFHVPLDRYILKYVECELEITSPIGKSDGYSWSKMDKACEYCNYQRKIRKKLKNNNMTPIEWELFNWHNAAKAWSNVDAGDI